MQFDAQRETINCSVPLVESDDRMHMTVIRTICSRHMLDSSEPANIVESMMRELAPELGSDAQLGTPRNPQLVVETYVSQTGFVSNSVTAQQQDIESPAPIPQ